MLVKIGGRLHAFRDKKGLTLRQFSDKSGVSVSHISNIENGSNFRIDLLFKLINGFPDLDVNWLLLGDVEVAAKIENQAVKSVQDGLDGLLKRLTDEEKAVVFASTQEMLLYRKWRDDVDRTLTDLKETVKNLQGDNK